MFVQCLLVASCLLGRLWNKSMVITSQAFRHSELLGYYNSILKEPSSLRYLVMPYRGA